MTRFGRFLCAIGIHSWEARSETRGRETVTFNRCRRRCRRYSRWIFVDAEPRRPW